MGEAIITIIYLIGILLFVFVVIPFMVLLGTLFGLAYGMIFPFRNIVLAVLDNINMKNWSWIKDDEPAQRSYFCGPGFRQLKGVAESMLAYVEDDRDSISDLSRDFDGLSEGIILGAKIACRKCFSFFAQTMYLFLSFVLWLTFTVIFGTALCVISLIRFIIFCVISAFEHSFIFLNRVNYDCPVCHERSRFASYACPSCYAVHDKLRPNVFGILHHKCNCHKKIPCTFFNGRSKLDLYCPMCKSPLVADGVAPVTFQLIGGTKAGKSVFLASFFHQYMDKLKYVPDTTITIPKAFQSYFEELDLWYNGEICPATSYMNSQMYPILIDSSIGITRQFVIYDVAGELFIDSKNPAIEVHQRQFKYCEGYLFLIDPFSAGKLREEASDSKEDMSDYSDVDPDKVFLNFVNYLISIGYMKPGTLCKKPVSVLIAKSDVKEVKREIGLAKIKTEYEKNKEKYESFDTLRNTLCRDFLMKNGFKTFLDSIESNFTNISFFPISAMGHSSDGNKYEPWGVLESVEWLISKSDEDLASLTVIPT